MLRIFPKDPRADVEGLDNNRCAHLHDAPRVEMVTNPNRPDAGARIIRPARLLGFVLSLALAAPAALG